MREQINERVATILKLLQQIEALNEAIAEHSNDEFTRELYEDEKSQCVKALAKQLSAYDITPEDWTT